MENSEMLKNLLELCGIPSVSETAGEIEMANKIAELLRRIRYFGLHPESVRICPVPGDPYDRNFVYALMRGNGKSAKTVVLLSHFDVVGVEDFGSQKDLAFDPVAYTRFLKDTAEVRLPNEAKEDLASGDYLFGRGTMDMKFGIAADLEVLSKAEKELDVLDGNILFLSVPDEEASSKGMFAAVDLLSSLQKSLGLHYICCMVSEPFFPKYPGDKKKYLYTGTIGKLLPVFYCVGKETHVCEPFSGLNPNLLTAKIIEKVDSNPALSDQMNGALLPPPACLKQADIKETYSVQTPIASFACFNFMTASKSPGEVMQGMLEIAENAFAEVLSDLAEKADRFAQNESKPDLPPITPRVVTYGELYDWCEKAHGEKFRLHMKSFLEEHRKDRNSDPGHSLSIETVKEAHRYCPCKGPMIVVFFSPPFYPHSDLEHPGGAASRISRFLVERAREEYQEEFCIEPVFPGVSDMSYLGLPAGLDADEMAGFFPLWGTAYRFPSDAISSLHIPFLNFGPLGKDAHKQTERLCVSFSFEKVAPLLFEAVEHLLKSE